MASFMTAPEFRAILKSNVIHVPTGLDRNALWRLCLENKIVEREFEFKEQITVVKCSLIKGMKLSIYEQNLLFPKIDMYVSVISRMLRRSSLVLYYHILRVENDDESQIPDLYTIPSSDTYWKRWLQIGLDKNISFPDDASEVSYQLAHHKFDDPQLAKDIKGLPHFDQILNYAGHTFWTCIETNTWYPLFNKLKRLCTTKLREWEIPKDQMSAAQFVYEIRSPIEKLSSELDGRVLNFVNEVKERLNASNNEKYISDTHAKDNMTYFQAFQFNMWMQRQFKVFERKMNIMIPVFNVKRTHVRLDLKTLVVILQSLFPERESVIKYKKLAEAYAKLLKGSDEAGPSTSTPIPKKVTEVKKMKDCSKEEWAEYKKSEADRKAVKAENKALLPEKMKRNDCNAGEWIEYKKLVEAVKGLPTKKETVSKAPHKKMIPKKIEVKKKKDCDVDEWTKYKQIMEERKVAIEVLKCNDEFQKLEAAHKENVANQLRMIQSFFTKIRKGGKWVFDGSIQTDGVSLSRQFSRWKRVEKKPSDPKEKVDIVDKYEKSLSCFIKETNTLVLGADPGRTNLASISYYQVLKNGSVMKQFWCLTRKRYYAESGINKRNKEKAIRFTEIKEQWTVLGTLRTVDYTEILDYVDKYNIIKDKWWSLAMEKIEAIDALNAYSGKHRVLDKFFGGIKKSLDVSHPGVNIVVAYGSAHKSMKSNGYGEVSAPVSATYKSCKKMLKNTIVEDESYTTKKSWESGTDCDKVFKTFRNTETGVFETFGHCHAKTRSPKVVGEENIEMVNSYNEKHKRGKKRRWKLPDENEKEKSADLHYPEIRGLRFCQESRNYVDRDRKSSLAIARLAVMRMTTQSRPSVFSHKPKDA